MTENVRLGNVNEYELSLEFWLCRALMERLNFPFQFLLYEMEDEVWFWRASLMDVELYLLLEGLEKLTYALNVVPG